MFLFLLIPLFSIASGSECPQALPPNVYRTRCTGHSLVLGSGLQAKKFLDCPQAMSPKKAMHPEVLRLVEKVRCLVGDNLVVTSGYRNRQHNLYSWAYVVQQTGNKKTVAKTSKHQVGQAVDFYIKGYKFAQYKNIEKKLLLWAGEFQQKLRGSKNKIWVKAYKPNEGRDPDNLHKFPYLHFEIRN